MNDIISGWLKRIDPAPLECDGVTRCISTVLESASIKHDVYFGSLLIEGIGEVYPHFWIDIDNWVVDLRARMWLGHDIRVPHGIFLPENGVIYQGTLIDDLSMFRVSSPVFEILCGQKLSSFINQY